MPRDQPPLSLARWKGLPGWRQVGWGVAGFFLVLSAVVQPGSRAVSSEVAAVAAYLVDMRGVSYAVAFDRDTDELRSPDLDSVEESVAKALEQIECRDPWGRPWRVRNLEFYDDYVSNFDVYSAGPNGIDEGGEGEDIVVSEWPDGGSLAENRVHAMAGLVNKSRLYFLILAAVLGWYLLVGSWKPRSSLVLHELRRAFWLAIPPVAACVYMSWQCRRDLFDLFDLWGTTDWPTGSAPFALAGNVAVACVLAALWVRLEQPPEPEHQEGTAERRFRRQLLLLGRDVLLLTLTLALSLLPSYLKTGCRCSNDSAAIGSLKTLGSAQLIFRENDMDGDGILNYGSLAQISSSGLVDSVLGAGSKQGYVFNCQPSSDPESQEFVWWATADPAVPGTTGDRFFATNQEGVVFYTTGGPLLPDPVTGAIASPPAIPLGK